MSRKEKLIKRFKNCPKDFTFEELVTLMSHLGYELSNKGKTSGSSIEFISANTNNPIVLHKPHPTNIIKVCYIKQIIKKLEEEGTL